MVIGRDWNFLEADNSKCESVYFRDRLSVWATTWKSAASEVVTTPHMSVVFPMYPKNKLAAFVIRNWREASVDLEFGKVNIYVIVCSWTLSPGHADVWPVDSHCIVTILPLRSQSFQLVQETNESRWKGVLRPYKWKRLWENGAKFSKSKQVDAHIIERWRSNE